MAATVPYSHSHEDKAITDVDEKHGTHTPPHHEHAAHHLPAAEDALQGTFGTTAEDDDDIRLTAKTFIVVGSVSILSLAITLGITGPSGLVSYIVRSVGSAADAPWIINAANVLQAVAGPPLALTTDLYGRRWTLVVFCCFAITGTYISGTAKSMQNVIIGQAFTGAGLALKPICYGIASEVLPRKHRAYVQYWISFLAALGGVIGAIGGPAFVKRDAVDGWRYFFYLEGACFVLALLGVLLFYRPPPRTTLESERSVGERVKAFDFIGWFLLAAAVCLFLVGCIFGGVRFPWSSPTVLGCLITGILLFIVFGLYEWKGRSDGLLHHGLFVDRNFPLACFSIFIEGAILFAFLSIYSQQVLKLYTLDPLDQGFRLLPFWIGQLIVCVPLAYFTTKLREVKLQLAFGYFLFLASAIMMTQAGPGTSTLSVAADAMAGIGFAIPLTLLIVLSQLSTPPKLIATASALMSTSRAIGGATAVAVYSAILNGKVADKVGPAVSASLLASGVPAAQLATAVPAVVAAGASYNAALAPNVPVAAVQAAFVAYKQAWADSYYYVWIAACAIVAPAILSILLTRSISHHFNNSIDAPAEDVHKHAPTANAAAVSRA